MRHRFFFDLSPESWTICPDLLEEALKAAGKRGKLPKAIIPTDLYGQSCDLARLEGLANEYEVPLIVDSAESAGANFRDRKCGSGGDMAILSFNGNKIITTGGGGMLVSKDEKVIEMARFLSTQAKDVAQHYQHSTYGYNYRMSNVAAAIGLGQLEVLDQRAIQRRNIFDRYSKALGNVPGVAFMPEPEWSTSSRWLTTATFDENLCGLNREMISQALLKKEIDSRPMWKPMHKQPLFDGKSYVGSGFDEKLFDNGLCLPSGSDMTIDEQDEVISLLLNILNP